MNALRRLAACLRPWWALRAGAGSVIDIAGTGTYRALRRRRVVEPGMTPERQDVNP